MLLIRGTRYACCCGIGLLLLLLLLLLQGSLVAGQIAAGGGEGWPVPRDTLTRAEGVCPATAQAAIA